MLKLTQEIKDEWVAALRSGEYKKGRRALKKEDGRYAEPCYCCLGVLSEVTGFQSDSSCYLRRDVYQFMPYPEQRVLAEMNDDGKSFATIADYIEENIHVD